MVKDISKEIERMEEQHKNQKQKSIRRNEPTAGEAIFIIAIVIALAVIVWLASGTMITEQNQQWEERASGALEFCEQVYPNAERIVMTRYGSRPNCQINTGQRIINETLTKDIKGNWRIMERY